MYDVDYMRKILLKGKENGFKICFHADELSALSGAEMGAELGAINMRYFPVEICKLLIVIWRRLLSKVFWIWRSPSPWLAFCPLLRMNGCRNEYQ